MILLMRQTSSGFRQHELLSQPHQNLIFVQTGIKANIPRALYYPSLDVWFYHLVVWITLLHPFSFLNPYFSPPSICKVALIQANKNFSLTRNFFVSPTVIIKWLAQNIWIWCDFDARIPDPSYDKKYSMSFTY